MVTTDVVSADSHVIEPHDLWQRYTPAAYADRVPRLVRGDDTDKLVGEDFESNVGLRPAANMTDDSPGGRVEITGRWETDVFPGGYDPHQRTKDLDIDGVDAEILFPTTALSFYSAIADTGYLWVLIRAYNTWLADFCGEYPDRLKGIGMLTVEDPDLAVAELTRCKELGHVGAMVPLFPGEGRSYADRDLDPLWAAAADLRMPVNVHSSTSRDKSRNFFAITSFTEKMLNTPYQIQRVLLELMFSGVFDRHPGLRIVSAENDAGWAGNTAERGDYWWTRVAKLADQPDVVSEHEPSHYLHRNVSHAFMRDRTAVLARDVIGPDSLMWGNDFPHYITTWPDSQALVGEYKAYLDPEAHAKVFGGNARALYGF